MALNTDSTNYLTVRRLWSIMSSFKDKIVTALSKKSDKSSTVSNVAWSSSKITKTINGTTTDVVSASTLKSAMSLNNVTNDAQVKRSEMGTANGVATLDANGIINTSQLPSYVDDVLEYSAKSQFPATGETGKIYVDTSTNLTWRWSGTTYVEISPSLALGETSSTAYRGDRGKAAYDHSQLTSGNPHHVTAADVSAVRYDTNAQGLTDTQKSNARTNIGAGTSSLTIGTTASTAAAGNHAHGNIANGGTLTDTAAAAAGNDYVVIRDADNAKIQTSTIKGTDVADAVSKKHSHSTLTLSTTAQAYDGSHTLALPSTDPYTSARTPASHTHGNIQNGGTLQTTDITIANGDKLVVTDSSDSNKVARASISFDGSTTTTALTPKGTFEAFAKAADITSAIQALDRDSVGGDGKYISAISETDGKISATATTMDTTPTANSTNAVTSGGVLAALNDKLDWLNGYYGRDANNGSGWAKIASMTKNWTANNLTGIWDVAYLSTGETRYSTLELNIRFDPTVGVSLNRFVHRCAANYNTNLSFAIYINGTNNTTTTVELWAKLSYSWHSVAIREVGGAYYKMNVRKQWTYYKTTGGGTDKPTADPEHNIQVADVTVSQISLSTHTHGNITSAGALQTTDVAIASGDKLVVTDSSDSNKVARTSVSFDGSTTTTALTPKGTFEAFAKSGDITSAIQALDVPSVGGDGKYISAISEADGKISATATTMDTTPTASSTKAVTSGGIKTALDNKADKVSITGATKCKITYNAQGIVTAGADLAASDIPNLPESKITTKYDKLFESQSESVAGRYVHVCTVRQTGNYSGVAVLLLSNRFWNYQHDCTDIITISLADCSGQNTSGTVYVKRVNLARSEPNVQYFYVVSHPAAKDISVDLWKYSGIGNSTGDLSVKLLNLSMATNTWGTTVQSTKPDAAVYVPIGGIIGNTDCSQVTNANYAWPALPLTDTGLAGDYYIATTASNTPNSSYNFHIHATIFKNNSGYRITQIAVASAGSPVGIMYIRSGAYDGTTWSWGSWTKILVSSDITTGSDNGTISVAGTDVYVKGLGGAAYLNTGTASGTVATGNHTHTTSIASDSSSGTVVTLAHDTQYKLTAGGTSVLFKTPADSNTDTKVTQTADTSNDAAYPILAKNTTATATITDTSRFTSGVTLNPKNKSLTATTFIGALSGNASTATHLANHGYVRLWASGQYDSTKPYALLAEKAVGTTGNWGYGQLFKMEVQNRYVIFKIDLRGSSSSIASGTNTARIIYGHGFTKSEVNKAVVVTYTYTANANCIVRIYSDLRLTASDWQRVSLRQLDNQAGDQCASNGWDAFTYYQKSDNTAMVASVTGTVMTNVFNTGTFYGNATTASAAQSGSTLETAINNKQDKFVALVGTNGSNDGSTLDQIKAAWSNNQDIVARRVVSGTENALFQLVKTIFTDGVVTGFVFQRSFPDEGDAGYYARGQLEQWKRTASQWEQSFNTVEYSNQSGSAVEAAHLSSFGSRRCWPYNTSLGTPYALLAQLYYSTTGNWGFGQLFKIESQNHFAIFKLKVKGSSTAVSDCSVDVLYSTGLTASQLSQLIVVRYGFTANSSNGALINIYTDMSLNLGSLYNRVTIRQLDNQCGDKYSYDTWIRAAFYDIEGTSGMVSTPSGAEVPLSLANDLITTISNLQQQITALTNNVDLWMTCAGTSWSMFNAHTGAAFDSGTVVSYLNLGEVVYNANTCINIEVRGSFLSGGDERFSLFLPYAYCGTSGSAQIRRECRQYVKYRITIVNTGSDSCTIYATSGGRVTSTTAGYIRRGTLWIDGNSYSTPDTGSPLDWDVGWTNTVAIGTIGAKSSRTWEIWWFHQDGTQGSAFSDHDYVYVTTIK